MEPGVPGGRRCVQGIAPVGRVLGGEGGPVDRPVEGLAQRGVAAEKVASLIDVDQERAVRRLDPEAARSDRLRAADAVRGGGVLDLGRGHAAEVEVARHRPVVTVVDPQAHVELHSLEVVSARSAVVRVADDIRLVVRIVVRPRVRAGRREIPNFVDVDHFLYQRELGRVRLEERQRQRRKHAQSRPAQPDGQRQPLRADADDLDAEWIADEIAAGRAEMHVLRATDRIGEAPGRHLLAVAEAVAAPQVKPVDAPVLRDREALRNLGEERVGAVAVVVERRGGGVLEEPRARAVGDRRIDRVEVAGSADLQNPCLRHRRGGAELGRDEKPCPGRQHRERKRQPS